MTLTTFDRPAHYTFARRLAVALVIAAAMVFIGGISTAVVIAAHRHQVADSGNGQVAAPVVMPGTSHSEEPGTQKPAGTKGQACSGNLQDRMAAAMALPLPTQVDTAANRNASIGDDGAQILNFVNARISDAPQLTGNVQYANAALRDCNSRLHPTSAGEWGQGTILGGGTWSGQGTKRTYAGAEAILPGGTMYDDATIQFELMADSQGHNHWMVVGELFVGRTKQLS